MKVYLTETDKKTILKNYRNVLSGKRVKIIDVEAIKNEIDYKESNVYDILLSKELNLRLSNTYKPRKAQILIYIVQKLSDSIIADVKTALKQNNMFFTEFVLIDFANSVDVELYKKFDTII